MRCSECRVQKPSHHFAPSVLRVQRGACKDCAKLKRRAEDGCDHIEPLLRKKLYSASQRFGGDGLTIEIVEAAFESAGLDVDRHNLAWYDVVPVNSELSWSKDNVAIVQARAR